MTQLKLELIKSNSNQKLLQAKVDAQLKKFKQFVIDSHSKLLADINLLLNKQHGNEAGPSEQVFEEPLSRKKDGVCDNVRDFKYMW